MTFSKSWKSFFLPSPSRYTMAAESTEEKKHLPKADADLGQLDLTLSDDEVKRRLSTYMPQKGEHAPKFLVCP